MLVEDKVTFNSQALVKVQDLRVYFATNYDTSMIGTRRERLVKAVDGVSLDIMRGEVISIVGESGSGKTTLGRAIVALTKPTSGKVMLSGEELDFGNRKKLRKLWKSSQMIFQDPYSTFNPLSTVYDTLYTPLRKFKLVSSDEEARKKVEGELYRVGLNACEVENKYPNQLSGGQRQRISIARAMIVEPEMIIADEPVSMIDVSLRAGILELLRDLNHRNKLTVVFITHDLAVAQYISDRIAVMYRGKIVELGSSNEVIDSSLHPYTELLLKSAPRLKGPQGWSAKQDTIFRLVDSRDFSGCRFYARCPLAVSKCTSKEPILVEVRPNHFVSCFERSEKNTVTP
jgi:peptide/nickel transport system ATP-binding protein